MLGLVLRHLAPHPFKQTRGSTWYGDTLKMRITQSISLSNIQSFLGWKDLPWEVETLLDALSVPLDCCLQKKTAIKRQITEEWWS